MKKLKELKEVICSFYMKDWTTTEKAFALADALLLGIVMGVLLSPKRRTLLIGCDNSRYSTRDDQGEMEQGDSWNEE